MFGDRRGSEWGLPPLERRILSLVKPKSLTEKKIAKALGIDSTVLSPVITDLILKGHLEMFRRRRMYFFTQELCTITVEGISALGRTRSPFQDIIGMIRAKAFEALDDIISKSPALRVAAKSARTVYRVAKLMA